MSSTELQLWMLAVAALAFVAFLVGFRWQARSAVSRWALALLAAIGCAAAPALTTRLDIEGVGPRPDLGHSLLVVTAIVAAVALLALLTGRSRASRHRPGAVPEAAEGLVQFPIDADSRGDVAARDGATDPSDGFERRSAEAVSDASPSAAPFPTPGGADAHPMSSVDTSDAIEQPIDGEGASRRVTRDADALDLTETQRLFRDLRERDREIDLPTDASWLAAPAGSPLDVLSAPGEGELIAAARATTEVARTSQAPDDAVDATLVAEVSVEPVDRPTDGDIATLAGGAPTQATVEPSVFAPVDVPDERAIESATAGAARKTAAESAAEPTRDPAEQPTTAPAAAPADMAMAIATDDELQARDPVDVGDDESESGEADGRVDASADATCRRLQAERLADAEREGRLAAQALADERAATIEHLRKELERIGDRHADLESRLKDRDRELERALTTARHAARLAREAATRRRELERSLDEMRRAKGRQQRATDRAVAIARNAIAALPAAQTSVDAPPSVSSDHAAQPTTGEDVAHEETLETVTMEDVADDANENASYLDPYDR